MAERGRGKAKERMRSGREGDTEKELRLMNDKEEHRIAMVGRTSGKIINMLPRNFEYLAKQKHYRHHCSEHTLV